MNTSRIAAGLSAALIAASLIFTPGRTQGQTPQTTIPPVPMPRPRPLPPERPWQGVAVKSVTVNAEVRDGIAQTEVSQVFENRTGVPQEGDFIFPIPAGASVSSFAMYDGEKRMDARLLDKDEATRTYEEIVRRRRDPALLTFVGRGALRARVFPIAPRSERRVTLKLTTVLPREGDAKKYAWTLTGPHLPGRTPEKVTVRVAVASAQPIGNVYSPTHDVSLRRDDARKVVATWESDGKTGSGENPEFALYIAPGDAKNIALSVLTYNASLPQVASLGGGARQSGYFLIVASPAITDYGKAALPRRVVIVLDRSGSMQGEKISQARSALKFALGRLRPQDSFNILTFSDGVDRFAPQPVAATGDNRKRATAFVEDIIADGGTNIDAALKAGLEQFPEKGSGNTLLFFTDGLPTVGTTNKDSIVRNAVTVNAKKARTFVFGVGYDVDVPFLDQVALSLRGDADYVRPSEDIEVKVSRFVAKTSAPVLENLKVSLAGVNAGEVYPKPDDLPDIFAGSQLVLVGRYTGGNAPATITLTGDANGRPQRYRLATTFPAVDTDADFLPRLWATRKIGYLMDEVRLRDGDARREVVDQIIALSKEYGVLTPYTAYFVPEPGATERTPGAGGFSRGGAGGFPGGASAPAPLDAMKSVRLGETAVNNSQGARAQRSQNQVGNVYSYAAKEGAERTREEALAQRIQNVAARTFYQVGPVWTDATYDSSKQKEIVKVKLYSPAYFALTRRNTDMAKWAALGEQVVVAANGTQAVQFGNEGRESLTEKELTALAGS